MKKQSEGGFLLSRVHHLSGRLLAKKLREHEVEINPSQGKIMFVLWREDGISISELARRTSLGKSTLTSMLDRLEQMGYLRRVPSSRDRRAILIERTEKDLSWQEAYVQVSQEMTRIYYAGFADNEIDEFETYLHRILINLSEHEQGEE
jgi:DNA-binding MarR family transcriptional regulator